MGKIVHSLSKPCKCKWNPPDQKILNTGTNHFSHFWRKGSRCLIIFDQIIFFQYQNAHTIWGYYSASNMVFQNANALMLRDRLDGMTLLNNYILTDHTMQNSNRSVKSGASLSGWTRHCLTSNSNLKTSLAVFQNIWTFSWFDRFYS